MNLEDKIKELEQLKLDRDALITKKDKLIKDRHSKLNFIINLLLTSAVFAIFTSGATYTSGKISLRPSLGMRFFIYSPISGMTSQG